MVSIPWSAFLGNAVCDWCSGKWHSPLSTSKGVERIPRLHQETRFQAPNWVPPTRLRTKAHSQGAGPEWIRRGLSKLRWALPGKGSVAKAVTVGLWLAQPRPPIPSGEHEHRWARLQAPGRGAPASQGWPSEGYPCEQDPRVRGPIAEGWVRPLRSPPGPALKPSRVHPFFFRVPEICPPTSSIFSFPLFMKGSLISTLGGFQAALCPPLSLGGRDSGAPFWVPPAGRPFDPQCWGYILHPSLL